MTDTAVQKKDASNSVFIVAAFILTSTFGVYFGPAGKQIRKVFAEQRDTRIITDDQLSIIVNMLGCVLFVLIILHHYISAKNQS
ncbi:hypothetical protein HDU67_007932 [Dinochytrium kinnereticum]|nr:hypothetical protein HDU67_007932 [Dinochytrium kinnereticum]